MAENESIGGIAVEITGDYSYLKADIDGAVQVAAAAGAEIASALNAGAAGADAISGAMASATSASASFEEQIAALVGSGSTLAEALAAVGTGAEAITVGVETAGEAAAMAAEQMSLFDTAIEVPYEDAAGQLNLFATELEPIPAAAAAAAEAARGLGDAEHEAGDEAHHAAGELGELGEKLVAFGEALAITEGLKELGAEALTAADNITRASISLTALTGSGEKAKVIIDDIEKLGIKDGLSLPALLTASTRMTNLLGSAAPVPELLAKIADGAAVMGTDIGRAADSFDRLVTMGTLGARQLLPLGLTLDQVATALNKVRGTSEATAENVSKLFKALDGVDELDKVKVRTEIVGAALEHLGGIAQKTAEQTFGGQWTILANQWEQIMRNVGDALLPVITGFTDLMKVEILPFVKDVTDGFNKLPAPVREAAVVIGLLAAAIVPVTLAIGGFGLAMSAAAGAVAPVIAGLVSLGGALTGAGASYTAMMATGIATATIWVGLAAAIADVTVAYVSMSRAENLAATAQAAAAKSLQEYELRLKQHGIDISDLQAKYAAGQLTTEQYIAALGKLRDEFLKAHPVLQEHVAATTAVFNASESARIRMQALGEAVASTRDKLAEVTAKYNEHKATTQDVAKAYDAWQGATNALKSAQTALLPVVTNVHHATKAFVDETRDFPDAAQAAADATDAMSIKIGAEAQALSEAQRWLDIVLKKYAEHNATAKDVVKAFDLVQAAAAALAKTSVDLPTVGLQKYMDTLFGAAGGWKKMEDAAVHALPALALPNAAFRDTESILADMGIKMDEVHNIFGNKLLKDYDELAGKQHTVEEEAAAWDKVSGSLAKLAKTDLPLVLKMYDEHYAQLLKQGAAEGVLLAAQRNQLQTTIDIAEQSGKSATSQIIALESVRLKQEALYNSTHALGDLAVGIEQDIWKGWQQVGSALVDDALEGKNFAKSMEDVGKQVVKMVMNDLVGYAFKELKTAIVGVGGAIKDVQGNWDALHKAIMDATGMTSGAKDAAGAVNGATGGAGGAISMVDAIANVGSLISNIVSNVQFAHMNDSLKVIVQHTLVAANELTNLREDAWSQFNQMFDRLGEVWRDMRTGFQALADGIVTGTTSAADDAAQTRNIFKDGVVDIVGAVRNTGDATKRTPPTSSGAAFNPFTGVQADIWSGLTMPSTIPPNLPSVPSSPQMATPNAVSSSSSTSNTIGAVTFNVYESQNPRQTVRSISESLKILSPQFAAYAT